jgi:hypothetical protein
VHAPDVGGLLHGPFASLLPALQYCGPLKEPQLRRAVQILIRIFSHSGLTTFFAGCVHLHVASYTLSDTVCVVSIILVSSHTWV